jgi:hypothetical protein
MNRLNCYQFHRQLYPVKYEMYHEWKQSPVTAIEPTRTRNDSCWKLRSQKSASFSLLPTSAEFISIYLLQPMTLFLFVSRSRPYGLFRFRINFWKSWLDLDILVGLLGQDIDQTQDSTTKENAYIRGPFEKFVDWRAGSAVLHREA